MVPSFPGNFQSLFKNQVAKEEQWHASQATSNNLLSMCPMLLSPLTAWPR